MTDKCKCCKCREPAGYVVRHGVYLENLCVKCWKKGEIIIETSEISTMADASATTNRENPEVDAIDMIERIAMVSEEMAFLSKLLIKHKGPNMKKYIQHGQELMGASTMLKGWGLAIMEEISS